MILTEIERTEFRRVVCQNLACSRVCEKTSDKLDACAEKLSREITETIVSEARRENEYTTYNKRNY